MNDSVHPLKNVARGLRVLYYALVLGLLLLIVPVALMVYASENDMDGIDTLGMLIRYIMANLLYGLIVFPLINLVGRTVCLLNSPASGVNRKIVAACMGADVLTILIVVGEKMAILPGVIRNYGTDSVPLLRLITGQSLWILIPVTLLTYINNLTFLFFIRQIATYVQAEQQRRRATVTFCISMLLVPLLFVQSNNPELMSGVRWSLLTAFTVLLSFLLYARLLVYVPQAIRLFLKPEQKPQRDAWR